MKVSCAIIDCTHNVYGSCTKKIIHITRENKCDFLKVYTKTMTRQQLEDQNTWLDKDGPATLR